MSAKTDYEALKAMPARIKSLGAKIAAGGAGRDAAYAELARIAVSFGQDPAKVKAALEKAKSGGR
jgi:hypothetical protein